MPEVPKIRWAPGHVDLYLYHHGARGYVKVACRLPKRSPETHVCPTPCLLPSSVSFDGTGYISDAELELALLYYSHWGKEE